uniref:Leucine-rich repeat-containing N-terminal plant-type domain-containing protein n=1 Tax=Setaria viridis TaxID=4556 RepID=A0A4U6W6T0_SETVI|nr:hypothetical protein SEVIR_2G442600v2 [Setaria viridis]
MRFRGLGENDVEAAAAIDQHLGEEDSVNGGAHHQRAWMDGYAYRKLLCVTPVGPSLSGTWHYSRLSAVGFWDPFPEQLAALVSLDLSGNSIEGQVPAGLAALGSRLEVLNLGGNRLSGVLHPALLRNLTGLHLLDLSGNQFTESELPPEIGEMSSLRWLFLQGSGLASAIPESFFGLEQLQVLDLSMNSLTGAVHHDSVSGFISS